MSRKDIIREFFDAMETRDGPPPAAPPPAPGTPAPARSGAVKAMGINLRSLAEEADSARTLRAQLEAGESVVTLDPALLDASFAADRLSPPDDAQAQALAASIAEFGQLVPILVRPHPDRPGRYQIAYGHRRAQAAQSLGLAVKTIVRPLSDAELVIAQGKENQERRNLSFIERALFAAHLDGKGLDRATVLAALSAHAADLTRYLAVARAVPGHIVRAIGPAPKAGRPRWMELAQAMARPFANEMVTDLMAQPDFASLDSDSRFNRVLATLTERAPSEAEGEYFRDPVGRLLVRIERLPGKTRLIVDDRLAPDLGAYLVERLPDLFAAFERREGRYGLRQALREGRDGPAKDA
jgi:ParB family chromosome partitioning protein